MTTSAFETAMQLADSGGQATTCRLQRAVEGVRHVTNLLRCAFVTPMLEEPPADIVFLIARTPQLDPTVS